MNTLPASESARPKYRRAIALQVAGDLCRLLKALCERLIVAGSLRRGKQEVGDIEILYIPRCVEEPDGLFEKRTVSQVDALLTQLIAREQLTQRRTATDTITWGPKNKLAQHWPTGMPVDFFAADAGNWFNYLVCRTGSAENNIRIASTARARGWKWHPYGAGFTDERGRPVPVTSEQDVFTLLDLPYLEPHQR